MNLKDLLTNPAVAKRNPHLTGAKLTAVPDSQPLTKELFEAQLKREEAFAKQLSERRNECVPVGVVVKDVMAQLQIQPSTDEAKLNKTERAYLRYLEALRLPWLGVQCFTIKLGDDTRYTSDFVTIGPNGELQFREVKGFMRGDAAVKLKVAARLYRFAQFILVRKEKNGWEHTVIKP